MPSKRRHIIIEDLITNMDLVLDYAQQLSWLEYLYKGSLLSVEEYVKVKKTLQKKYRSEKKEA